MWYHLLERMEECKKDLKTRLWRRDKQEIDIQAAQGKPGWTPHRHQG